MTRILRNTVIYKWILRPCPRQQLFGLGVTRNITFIAAATVGGGSGEGGSSGGGGGWGVLRLPVDLGHRIGVVGDGGRDVPVGLRPWFQPPRKCPAAQKVSVYPIPSVHTDCRSGR